MHAFFTTVPLVSAPMSSHVPASPTLRGTRETASPLTLLNTQRALTQNMQKHRESSVSVLCILWTTDTSFSNLVLCHYDFTPRDPLLFSWNFFSLLKLHFEDFLMRLALLSWPKMVSLVLKRCKTYHICCQGSITVLAKAVKHKEKKFWSLALSSHSTNHIFLTSTSENQLEKIYKYASWLQTLVFRI